MNFQDSLNELNILLGDTNNTTFTPEEKTQALTYAWRDSYVVKTVKDNTVTYIANTFDYAIPTTLSTVKDILYSTSADVSDEGIPADLWEITDGRIYFTQSPVGYIPTNTGLVIKGNYKYTTADTIADTKMQEYVVSLAGVRTLTLLTYKKANLFLKNDTSMGELIALKRELQADVEKMRLGFTKEYESA